MLGEPGEEGRGRHPEDGHRAPENEIIESGVGVGDAGGTGLTGREHPLEIRLVGPVREKAQSDPGERFHDAEPTDVKALRW